MSICRQQAVIEAPVERVWELIGDPNRHPEWWPRVLEVDCEDLSKGCHYRQVTKGPMGTQEDTVIVEELDECREVKIRCLETGTFVRWHLTDARGSTFIDAEFGCDPETLKIRAFDTLVGRRFFRGWMEQALRGLRTATARAPAETT